MKIIMLGSSDESTSIVFNYLSKEFEIEKIVIENSVPMKTFLYRRLKKLGAIKVLGQIMFKVIINPLLKSKSKNRIQEIISQYGLNLDDSYKTTDKYKHFESVNSDECISFVKDINPDIVVVNGTRILSKKLLDSVNAKFINMHLGITPKYRGVHGAYWAYYNGDDINAGVTVHLVDPGIDTGGILYQDRIDKTDIDNYFTYPYLQVAKGIPLEVKAIKDIISGNLKTIENDLPSKLYSHPTFFEYVLKYIVKKVK